MKLLWREWQGGGGRRGLSETLQELCDLLFPCRVESGVEFLSLTLIPSHPSQPVSPWGYRVKDGERRGERRGRRKRNKVAKIREERWEKVEQKWEDYFSELPLEKRSRLSETQRKWGQYEVRWRAWRLVGCYQIYYVTLWLRSGMFHVKKASLHSHQICPSMWCSHKHKYQSYY